MLRGLFDRILSGTNRKHDMAAEVPVAQTQPIAHAANSLPETWAWFPDVGGERVVAEQLCDREETRAELEDRLRQTRPELPLDEFAGTAIWVPRRDSSDIQGMLQAQWVLPDEGEQERASMEDWSRLFEPAQRPWLTVHSQGIQTVELRAGPALFIQEITSRNDPPESGADETMMVGTTMYAVFPPGSSEFLNLIFKASGLEWLESLTADAAWIADTVEITLGDSR